MINKCSICNKVILFIDKKFFGDEEDVRFRHMCGSCNALYWEAKNGIREEKRREELKRIRELIESVEVKMQ